MKRIFFVLLFGLFSAVDIFAQRVEPGAEQLDQYLPKLSGLRVGIFANQTTVVYDTLHLVDVLKQKGIRITRLFSPEHGFRGTADAGEKVGNMVDPKTGIPVISLYGKNRIPKKKTWMQ